MTNQLSTQTKVSTFNFDNHAIRTITINNEPWFLSIDICNALNIANSRDAINKLDEDEYQTLSLKDTVGLTDSIANQVQSVGVVSESGMYTLILRCREAVKKGSIPHRFRKWVTAEVLPAIRKTGKYDQLKPEQFEDAIGFLNNLKMPTLANELNEQDLLNIFEFFYCTKDFAESVDILLLALKHFDSTHQRSVSCRYDRVSRRLKLTLPAIEHIYQLLNGRHHSKVLIQN